MTMQTLVESMIDRIGSTPEQRLSISRQFSPQSVFVDLEKRAEEVESKNAALALLHASLASHAGAIRQHYPVYVEKILTGTPEARVDTEDLFAFHNVELDHANYSMVMAAILDEVNKLTDYELSVLRFF